jgi:uncharacterized protein (TIGR00251 family)
MSDRGPPAATIVVRLTPRGGADAISGWRDGVLEAKVRAPAEGGKANEALCRMLAKVLGVPASSVGIESGHRARMKRVRAMGIGQEEAMRRLEAP